MSTKPQDQVYVTHRYAVSQNQEPAVVIGMRDYNRLVERLDGFEVRDWADLWLAVAGAAAALCVSTLVGALTLPTVPSGTTDILWTLTATGASIFTLCIIGYLTQRRNRRQAIGDLKKDLEIHKSLTAGITISGGRPPPHSIIG